MTEIVFIDKKKIFTTSKAISDGCKLQHHTITKVLQKFSDDFEEFGDLRFDQLPNLESKTNQTEKVYFLSEGQATYLIVLLKNTYIVRQFKKRLVKEFLNLRKTLNAILIRQNNDGWQALRSQGKAIRKSETDIIKEFVEYATAQGSLSAQKYYMAITKMENKALFLISQKFKNVSEILDEKQLNSLKVADIVVERAIEEGMQNGLPYKEIYQMAKQRIETISEQALGGKSIVQKLAVIDEEA